MKVTLITDRFGYQSAIEEAKEQWLEDLLRYLGVDISLLEEVGSAHFLEYLIESNLSIIDYPTLGAIAIYSEEELVGEWAGPTFNLKLDEKGVLYYEIEIEYWSIMDEDINLSS